MNTSEKDKQTTYFNIEISNNEPTFTDAKIAAKIIFDFLVTERGLQDEPLALCFCDGSVVSAFPHGQETSDDLNGLQQAAASHTGAGFPPSGSDGGAVGGYGFFIAAGNRKAVKAAAEKLKSDFELLFSAFGHNQQLREFIFDGLDALPNSICVYDKELRLLYANSDFCDYLHIKDREAELGKHINDVLHTCGTRFTSIKKPHSYLKVNDVIKYGKPVIDWEVEVTSDKSPGECMIASNDMYPLFDTRNEVSGVAEISRSRNTKINQVRDTLGLVADYTFEDILGNSRPMQDVKKLAMSFAISPYNVLIYGESGTGKELFAQSIHNYSTRRNKPFVAINCASISPELIDSELFGYESGAFTGASKNGHVGKIELSNEGTLFLDEVAELPLHAQTRLLRTLETGQITRLGGSRNISVDVRVIAATNRSLEKMIEEGLFREDLYYRLMVLNITIPPLRERPEDIIPCCEFFLRQAMRTNTAGKKTIEKNAMKLLLGYDWPGNVRELRNIINRVYVMSSSSVISRESLIAAFQFNNPHYSGLTAEMTPAEMLREKQLEISRSYASLLKEALLLASGNKAEAAKLMGVSRKTIYNMLEKYKEYLK